MTLSCYLRLHPAFSFKNSTLLRLKLAIALFGASLLNVNAASFAQIRITVSAKNASLENLLKEVSHRSGYGVFYIKATVKGTQPITIYIKQALLSDVLNQIFKGQPVEYVIQSNTIVVQLRHPKRDTSMSSSGAGIEVSGIVADEEGKALAGATVKVKGSNIATVTNNKGYFNLKKVPENATLLITFVGYKQLEIKAAPKLSIKLLRDNSTLNNVVVVGYGTQKKISVTAAVVSIGNKELIKNPTPNVTNSLVGRLPGLISQQTSGDPGADGATLFIRGPATLNNSEPLVLVDGIERPLGSVSSQEIESVTLLKDASATAVYGVRGANGVIIVTTKRGVVGQAKVSVTQNFGLQQATRLPKFLDSYNFALLKNEALANEGAPPLYDQTQLNGYKNHTDPYLYPDIDYFKEFIKPFASQEEINANVTGGTKLAKYFVDAGFLTQNGLYKHTSETGLNTDLIYTRFNFRSNVDLDILKDFRLSVNMAVRSETRNGPVGSTDQIFRSLMRTPPNVNLLLNPDGSYGGNTFYDNILAILSYNGFLKKYTNLLETSLTGTYQLNRVLKGLSAKALLAYTNQYVQNISRTRSGYASYTITGKDAQGNYIYGARMGSDAPVVIYQQNFADDGNFHQLNFEGSLNYDNHFGKHNITGLLLFSLSRKTLGTSQTFIWPYSYEGLVARVTYNWNTRYLAEFNMGYNGSEQFPPGKRYGFFPSLSAGWVISEEPFLKRIKSINLLKIRASYGQVGNDKQGDNRFLYLENPYTAGVGYAFGLTNNINPGGIYEGAFGNKKVGWEKANKYDIGLESAFFNSRLTFNADVFYEKRSNILAQPGSIPLTVGAALPVVNLGVVQNKGYELVLGYQDKIGEFNYSISSNLSFAINKIIYQDEPQAKYPWQRVTGQSLATYFGLKTDGFYQNQAEIDRGPKSSFDPGPLGRLQPGDIKYVDQNKDGVIDAYDVQPIGKPSVPRYISGMNLGVSYKGFDFSALLQAAFASSFIVGQEGAWEFFNNGKAMDIHLGRWTPATAKTATYPRLSSSPSGLQHNYQNSDFWLKNVNYLRLKQVEIGYSFPESILKKLKLNKLRVYVNGANLLTWSPLKYLDPEGRDGNGYGSGYFYPPLRIFNTGINVNF